MISRFKDLLPLLRVDIPHCDDPLILQHLAQVARTFCRETEAWRERLTYNVVDSQNAYNVAYAAAIAQGKSTTAADVEGKNAKLAARDYILKSHYEVDIIRPWKVWTTGDENRVPTDPDQYNFTPSTSTLTFRTDLQQYTPVATNWATAQVYAAGSYVIQDSLRYLCSIAHTSDVFATDLAAYRWQLMPNDLIVRAVLLPRMLCNELAAWFMEKWGEGIIAGTKAELMSMKNKNWSSPERVQFFQAEYNRYKALALRERFTEDKSTGTTFQTPAFVR